MIEVQILVPVKDNRHRTFKASVHKGFENELTRLFPSYSRLPGLMMGQWTDDDGTQYADLTRIYIVGVEGLIAKSRDILAAVAYAKTEYRQLAIYVRYLNCSEVL